MCDIFAGTEHRWQPSTERKRDDDGHVAGKKSSAYDVECVRLEPLQGWRNVLRPADF